MATRPKHKRFFSIDDVGAHFGLSLVDMGVMAAEGQLRLSVPVAGLRVEIGDWEEDGDGHGFRIPAGYRMLNGLVDLYPVDGWTILRNGTGVVHALPTEGAGYTSIETGNPDQEGLLVTRDELGVRREEWRRLEAQDGDHEAEADAPARSRRGVQPTHDWDAARLEACRLFYFEGVPESQAALIRHMQAWFASKGLKVPDDSTLKRRFRDVWAMFGPEAKKRAA